MIGLRVNGYWLDLEESASLKLQYFSPAFDLDSIGRLFSLPFVLQLTETNTAAFRHAYRLDTRTAQRTYPAELYIGGMLHDTGILRITGRNAEAIECAFQNDQMDWIETMKATRLRSLSLTKEVTQYRPVINLRWIAPGGSPPVIIFLLEVNGLDYSSFTVIDIANNLNTNFGAGFATYSNPALNTFEIAIDTSIENDIIINLTPQQPFSPGVEYSFPGLRKDTAAEEAVKDDWEAHLAAILAVPDDHVFPVVYAPDLYGGKNAAWLNYANYTSPDEIYVVNEIGEDLEEGEDPAGRGWARTVIPMPFVYSILQEVFSLANAGVLIGDWAENEEMQKLVFFNNRTLDALYHPQQYLRSVLARFYIYPPYNGFAAQYNLADHLPDITAYELLLWLASTFALTYQVRGGRAYIRSIESQLNQRPLDWTEKTEPSYSAETAQYDGFTLDYERQGYDNVVVGQLEPYAQPGQQPWQHKSRFFSLYHNSYADDEREWLVPEFQGKASSPALQTSERMPAMLLLWRDVKEDSAGNEYPLATAGNTDFAGASTGAHTLNWQGADGLYTKFWASYIRLIEKGVPCTRSARLTLADIQAWRDNPAQPVYIYSPHGTSISIIRNISITVFNRQQNQFLCELETLIISSV